MPKRTGQRACPRLPFPVVLLLALLCAASAVSAQEPAVQRPAAPPAPAPPPQPAVGPAIERIETASAVSTDAFGAVSSVRELPDGRVLVNDGTRRRLLLLDTALVQVGVVLDSLSDVAHTYGVRAGALVPYAADSTLFVDPAALAMVVIGPDGRFARVRSIWRAEHITSVSNTTGSMGFPGVDGRGRIVYRVTGPPTQVRFSSPSGGFMMFPIQADSGFVVAADLTTRKVDTLAVIQLPRSQQRPREMGEGRWTFEFVANPLPAADQWAVTPDGTIAIVRWRDYRVEYIHPDGSASESAKLPYEWQRLDDDGKQVLVDSVRQAQQRFAMNDYIASLVSWSNQYGKPYPADLEIPSDFMVPPGIPRDWILPPGLKLPDGYVYACGVGEEPAAGANPAAMAMSMPVPPPPGAMPPGAGMPSCLPRQQSYYMMMYPGGGTAPPAPTLRAVHVIQPTELPDYRPPFSSGPAGAVRADYEGNLWIRTIPPRPIPGGPVYDIISREGELVRRIQIPPNYTLVGFGRDRVVYLSTRDPSGVKLARVRLR